MSSRNVLFDAVDNMLKLCGMCRGAGKGYYKFAVERGEESLLDGCHAHMDIAGRTVPVMIYQLGTPQRPSDGLVVSVPLLDGVDYDLLITSGDGTLLWRHRISSLLMKIRSRLTYQFMPELTKEIRDIDKRLSSGKPLLQVDDIFPATGGGHVVRFHITFPNTVANPRIEVMGADGEAVASKPMVLERSTTSMPSDSNLTMTELRCSVILPDTVHSFCIVAWDEEDPQQSCFDCLLPDMVTALLESSGRSLRHVSEDAYYNEWFFCHRATYADLTLQQNIVKLWDWKPLISVVCVVYRPDSRYLQALLTSILEQSYRYFECIIINVSGDCPEVDSVLGTVTDARIRIVEAGNVSIAENTNIGIRMAQGDYVTFVDHDDVIEPDALYRFVSVIRENPDADLLYCDEDKLVGEHYEWPVFKPAFNPELLGAYNYITHMLMVSKYVLDKVDLSPEDVSGAQDYDLTWKCAERARRICNVPYVLYHWRSHPGSTSVNAESKPYAQEAGRLAVQRHFDRVGISAVVSADGSRPFRYRVRYPSERSCAPKVNILIPTKDHIDLLKKSVSSIMEKTDYSNFDVTIIENNSVERVTFDYYNTLEEVFSNIKVIRWPGKGFNYSAICNFGAKHCSGERLVFVNNDTEIVSSEWLTSMVGLCDEPEVGIVGAKLIYRDYLVQHGGVWVAPGGCEYINQNYTMNDLGYMETLQYPYDVAAVTGACQMIKRSVFDELSGFDEELAVGFNDIDLCLRAGKHGYRVVFDPYAVLFHNEYGSRGRDNKDVEKTVRMRAEVALFNQRWSNFCEGVFINRNLNQRNGHFQF